MDNFIDDPVKKSCLVIGIILAIVGAIVALAISRYIWRYTAITNGIAGGLFGFVYYFSYKSFDKILSKYYPESTLPSYKFYDCFVSIFFLVLSILELAAHIVFTVIVSFANSYDNSGFVIGMICPFIGLSIAIVINVIGLLFLIPLSIRYRKAILLDKAKNNTNDSVDDNEYKTKL